MSWIPRPPGQSNRMETSSSSVHDLKRDLPRNLSLLGLQQPHTETLNSTLDQCHLYHLHASTKSCCLVFPSAVEQKHSHLRVHGIQFFQDTTLLSHNDTTIPKLKGSIGIFQEPRFDRKLISMCASREYCVI